MKKTLISVLSVLLIMLLAGCRGKGEQTAEIIGGEDQPTSIASESAVGENETGDVPEGITEEQALSAIRNYCYAANPDLEGIEQAGEYPVYWDIVSSDENEIVVLFESYTGAQLYYYVDSTTGDCYVTEYVPGISSEEERTDESFNVKEYLPGHDASSDTLSSLSGTWQTVSMGYEDDDGTLYPEYDVQFTDSDIQYGHLKDGTFSLDHSDRISLFEETAAGRYRVQAEAANGVRYTYQTSESDTNVLEYYETWDETDFSEMYSGGASLVRCN